MKIVFTGHGEIASKYIKDYSADMVSFRNLTTCEMEDVVSRYDIVIHNSANIFPKKIEEAINDNFLLTKKILDTVYKINPEIKFIHLSSMSILKNSEDYLEYKDMSMYALSKYLAERYCLQHKHPNTYIVRFSTIFYGNPLKDGLSKLIYDASKFNKITIYNKGISKRDFLPISILIKYLNKIVTCNSTDTIHTVCAGYPTSFYDVANFLKLNKANLEIENIDNTQINTIVYDFKTEAIEKLGRIDFKLNDFILENLNENINI